MENTKICAKCLKIYRNDVKSLKGILNHILKYRLYSFLVFSKSFFIISG